MTVTRWFLEYGGTYQYEFPRNPDRYGGDTDWVFEPRFTELAVIGANRPNIQIDGVAGRRTISFTAITGNMMRRLRDFFLRETIIYNCRDHLYPTTPTFNCFIASFTSTLHPTFGDFPGSVEDTYDVGMTLVKM
jgi:hypothetical protein